MSGKEVLEQALKLKPDERFMVIEGKLKSLDKPDKAINSRENSNNALIMMLELE